MSAKVMKDLREAARLTQTEMASHMGLGKTAYVDLETDDPDWKKFRHRHLLALERVSMVLALERGDIDLALPAVRRDALRLASLIAGEATNDVDHTYVVKPSKGGWIIRSGGQDLKFDDAFKNSAEAVARASMIAYNNLSATGSTSRVVVAPVGAPPQTVAVFRAAPVSATSLS